MLSNKNSKNLSLYINSVYITIISTFSKFSNIYNFILIKIKFNINFY